MATTKAHQKAVNKYIKRNYDRLHIIIPKGYKQVVDAYAKERGETINSLVNNFLRNEIGVSETEWKQGKNEEE